jgi:hypothetical protein
MNPVDQFSFWFAALPVVAQALVVLGYLLLGAVNLYAWQLDGSTGTVAGFGLVIGWPVGLLIVCIAGLAYGFVSLGVLVGPAIARVLGWPFAQVDNAIMRLTEKEIDRRTENEVLLRARIPRRRQGGDRHRFRLRLTDVASGGVTYVRVSPAVIELADRRLEVERMRELPRRRFNLLTGLYEREGSAPPPSLTEAALAWVYNVDRYQPDVES